MWVNLEVFEKGEQLESTLQGTFPSADEAAEWLRAQGYGDIRKLKDARIKLTICGQCLTNTLLRCGPLHEGYPWCRMGDSIASGGTVDHCTCAGCF